jgi:hypothetical protein
MRSRVSGWALVVGGVLFNRRVLELFSSDGAIESGRVRAAILVCQAVMVLAGIVVLRGWHRPAMKGPALWISVVGISSLFAVGLGEILVRLVVGPLEVWAPPPVYVGEMASRPSSNFDADSLVGWRMRPATEFGWTIDGRQNSYRSTADGFRSNSLPSVGQVDSAVVVVVGDSFAFGTGVAAESTFASRLDAMLEGVGVRNLALPGMGVDQMWMVLRHYALRERPRVVVAAFIDQDWDRSLTAFRVVEGMAKPTFMVEGNTLRPAMPEDAPNAALRWLERRSALLGLVRASDRAIGYRFGRGRWWRTNVAILEAMATEARGAGSEILFVRLPIRGARPFPALARAFAEMGAAYADLTVYPPDGIHFATDDHINDEGHAYVAQALIVEVRRLISG